MPIVFRPRLQTPSGTSPLSLFPSKFNDSKRTFLFVCERERGNMVSSCWVSHIYFDLLDLRERIENKCFYQEYSPRFFKEANSEGMDPVRTLEFAWNTRNEFIIASAEGMLLDRAFSLIST